ncbi:MAG: malto-oligosyltrehalose synthase [Candidatus Bathyarchaeia archaeon]
MPTATYRVQLNKNFAFSDLKAVLPYLKALGVSHIYASPIFQAKKGSFHGYDVVDPTVINQELGSKEGFEDLAREVHRYGLGLLQDIVPNHASYSLENRRIYDVLQNGADSRYGGFFDVDWKYPSKKLRGKLLVPFLSEPIHRSISEGKLTLVYNGDFKVKYNGLEFPLSAETAQQLQSIGVTVAIQEYNRNPTLLKQLLSKQHYCLAYWKTALERINYRRFFDILDLIGVRVENLWVFEELHSLIFNLVQRGLFSGLRVDHIDGLYDPETYLQQLRKHCPDTYLLVEKILTGDEELSSWPVQGTTGYEFLDRLNKLFVLGSSQPEFDALYRYFTGNTQSFGKQLYEAKKTVLETVFLGDTRNLAWLFSVALQKTGYPGRFDLDGLVAAVVELMANFPVYRSYIDGQQRSSASFRAALEVAESCNPHLAGEFNAIAYLLRKAQTSPEALHALMRFQQFTGAVMAKGFEDTVLYRYTRLLSLNEVGSNPTQFGITKQRFYAFIQQRHQKWPLTLNASSTHDTKRGEDIHARLNVLSELPAEFRSFLEQIRKVAPKKRQVGSAFAPDGNEEFCLSQTLLGAYPWSQTEQGTFPERISLYMLKALREAKVHTNWITPNLPYEEAVAAYTAELLDSQTFKEAFLPFQEKIAYYGAYNSLSQTLLKITCPGVPDFYQGSELWNLSLVDPDNRGNVDYTLRQRLLQEVLQLRPRRSPELLSNLSDGKIKLYLIYKALKFRGRHKRLFEEGAFLPLDVKGMYAENVVAFCRKTQAAYVLVVVPRFLAGLLEPEAAWSSIDWADTYISLPPNAPAKWTDAFTGRTVQTSTGQLFLYEVLDVFPVALLGGEGIG